MKTIRTKAAEALPETEQALFAQIYAQIAGRFRRRVLIWLGITFWLAVTLTAAAYFRSDISPLFVFSFVFLAGFAVLWIMVSVTEQSWKKNLPPAPPPTGEQLTADAACRKEQEVLRNERGMLLIGAFFIFPLIPLFLLVAAVRSYCAKKRPGTAYCAAELCSGQIARRINAVTFFFLPLLLMCILMPIMWQHNGRSRVSSLNMTARGILNSAISYQVDLDTADNPPDWKTTIVPPGEIGVPGSLQYGISSCYPTLNTENLWYAVVIDENGEITEAYCSRSPLTEADLVPPDYEAQCKLASSPLHAREVIGYGSRQQTN